MEEDAGDSQAMGSQWGSSPNPEVASIAGSRDLAHVLLSPRVGGTTSPLNPRRPFSSKKTQETDPYIIFSLFKGGHDIDESSVESLPRLHHGIDDRKLHKKEAGFFRKLRDYFAQNASRVSGKKSWGQWVFYLSALLMFTFLFVKIVSFGWLGVDEQSPGTPKVLLSVLKCYYEISGPPYHCSDPVQLLMELSLKVAY